ncbi:hypothetical protein FDECE_1516 [Fusarium decemcellulare]|nr:hypothetical protein FDECE_1516 [Fusarium decemcellulare]
MSNRGRGGGFFSRGDRRGGILGSAVRGVAGGIGLASESISAYKDKKKAEKEGASGDPSQQSQASAASTSSAPAELDGQNDLTERQWELDETQSELLSNDASPPPDATQDGGDAATKFIRAHSQAYLDPAARLELPVILAQRRPKDRTRGFIRGYAPMLEDVGIDQTTWLDFLDTFDKSIQASPWVQTINLAGIPGFFVPFGPGMAINVAVAVAIKVASETQNKQRSNKFLNKMNEEFFRPRGLCCLVMTWRPDSGKQHEDIDLTSTIASSMDSYSSFTGKFKTSDGKTYGDFALPEAAPLIFPTLDVLDAADSEEAKGLKQSLGKKKNFIADYYDKRAQLGYANERPDNLLANQQETPQFSSRYADPGHPSNNGSLLSLVTGGYVDPTSLRRGLRGQSRGGLRGGRLGGGRGSRTGQASSQRPIGAVRNFLFKQDVLYLMVVNMPTDEELSQAREMLNQ